MAIIPFSKFSSGKSNATIPNSAIPSSPSSGGIIPFASFAGGKMPSIPKTISPQTSTQPSYFTGKGYGASNLTDPYTGKPLATYENQGLQADQLLNRTATTFDPTVPQKIDKSILQNGRMPESASQLVKQQLGGQSSDELDHAIALELGGANVPGNLNLQPGRQGFSLVNPSTYLPSLFGTSAKATDTLENQLANKVVNGQISLVDAHRQLLKAKGITLTEDKTLQTPEESPIGSALSFGENLVKGIATGIYRQFIPTQEQYKNSIGGTFIESMKQANNFGDAVNKTLGKIKEKALAPITPEEAKNKLTNAVMASMSFESGALKEIVGKALNEAIAEGASKETLNNIMSISSKDAQKLVEKVGNNAAKDLIKSGNKTAIKNTLKAVAPEAPEIAQNAPKIAPELQPLAQEARKYKSAEEFANKSPSKVIDELRTQGVRGAEQRMAFWEKATKGMDKTPIIDSLNPTGGLLVDYTPQARMTAKLADNITTLDKTMGKSPDEVITIYRGATKNQKSIVGGDFVTTNPELARSYTGDGNVLSKKVKLSDVLDDINEPLGEEYIYRPKSQLTDFYNQAAGGVKEGEAGFVNVGEDVQQVKDYIQKSQELTKMGNNISDNFYNLKNATKADNINTRNILEKSNLTPEDQEAIYNWMENPKEKITPEQLAKYNESIRPLVEGANKIAAELKGLDIPIPKELSPEHVTRQVVGRGGFVERLTQGFRGTGTGSLLSKTAGFTKHRTMMAIEDDIGTHKVVSIKDGRITAWDKGKAEDMGAIKLTNLEKPIIQNGKLKYSTSRRNLSAMTFVDKNGKEWTITDATSKEIEANTNVRYYKTPLVNELQRFNKLNQIKRATDFIESTKNALEKADNPMLKKIGSYDIPTDWKTTDLPQLRGYMMPKRLANIFDSFNEGIKRGDVGAFTKLSLFLRTTIFFNPLIHIPNIAVHWVVERGLVKWANPIAYKDLFVSGTKAVRDVLTMNDNYVKALKEGAPLLYSETRNADLYKVYLDKAGIELIQNRGFIDTLSKVAGLPLSIVRKSINGLYKLSGDVTWATNDIATLQSVYEKMGKGMNWEDAIKETGKHIPNYRLPAQLMGSKQLMDTLKNPNITMFSAYHYGALKSYVEMAKDLLTGNLRNKASAFDKLLMLGIVTYVIYPELDKIAKQITGNKNASLRRAGASTFPYNLQSLIQGKTDLTTFLSSIVTPAVIPGAIISGIQGYSQYPTKTEFQANPLMATKESTNTLAGQLISPYGYAQKISSGKTTIGQTFLQFLGIKTSATTPSIRGANSMIYDQRPSVLKKAKDLISQGNVKDAGNLVSTYNKNLFSMLVGSLTDTGMPENQAKQKILELIGNPQSKLKSYFITGITQQQIDNYNRNKNKTSLEKLILK